MTHPALSLRASIALVCLAGSLPLAVAADSAKGVSKGGAKVAEGRILVKPRAGMPEENLAKLLQKRNARSARKLNRLGIHVVEVPVGEELRVVNELNRDASVAFAEPDLLVPPAAVVNDPSYGSQWHLPLMTAPTAWLETMGAGVTVAVCDTGINAAHPDLSGQVINGYNTASNTTDTSDINGHGTWVAGVIAAKVNNLIGGASVAPTAKLLAMRITDRTDSWAYFSDMAECITWAADHGARVANLSFNGAAGSSTVAGAGSYMMNKGGVVVVAAGNDGADMGYTNSDYLFTAGATTSADARASYSNYGAYIDIAAPGSGIFTTDRSGGYATVNGTSFASPNAAATAALIMAVNPGLTPTDVLSIVTNTAKDLGAAGWDPEYGFGRVDAGAAVTMAANVATSDRTPPTVTVASPTASATVKDLVTVDVQATDDFGVASVDFFVDGAFVTTETQQDQFDSYMYRFAWDSTAVTDGPHKLTAKAKDSAGNVGSSREVSVTVANNADTTPPTITSKVPASGAVVSGTMTMSATATDNVGTPNVTVSGGGVSCSSTGTASCTLNLKKVPVGTTIVVSFTATDAAGNQAREQASVVVGGTTTTTTTTCVPNPAGKCR